ncbi:hypothetical protein ACQV5M_22585, partial [Leptospira sp. SA-E8]|uniref:hypothetical protein n=1 Tax=Leptospira sp. SA-E8 TaxID=3422259 RepID=UPI003EC0DAC2
VGRVRTEVPLIPVTSGQVQHEWSHLLQKLAVRNPALHAQWQSLRTPECHPLFRLQPGPIETWERVSGDAPKGV